MNKLCLKDYIEILVTINLCNDMQEKKSYVNKNLRTRLNKGYLQHYRMR